MGNSACQVRGTGENASSTSTASMSPMAGPALRDAFSVAGTGPCPPAVADRVTLGDRAAWLCAAQDLVGMS